MITQRRRFSRTGTGAVLRFFETAFKVVTFFPVLTPISSRDVSNEALFASGRSASDPLRLA